MLCRKAGRDEGMVLSDRTKGCCSSDLNEPLHPNHDQFAELDAHNFESAAALGRSSPMAKVRRWCGRCHRDRSQKGHSRRPSTGAGDRHGTEKRGSETMSM